MIQKIDHFRIHYIIFEQYFVRSSNGDKAVISDKLIMTRFQKGSVLLLFQKKVGRV